MKMKLTLLTFLSVLIGVSCYAQPTIGTTAFGTQTTFGILATGNSTVSANAAGWTCTLVNQVVSGTPAGTISMSIINSADTMLNISTPVNHTYQYISMKSSNTPTTKFKLNSFRFGAVTQANSYTINGYKDGVFVTGATTTVALAALSTQTTATYNLITVSNISAFGNIDEFRIFPVGTVSGAVVHRLDDIDISTAVAANSSPSFNNGATQNTLSCGSSLSLNTLLAVTDADNNQTLTWSVTGSPANGTLSGFSTTGTSNTGSVTPAAALAYTPNSGFEGTDNFTIQVSDGAATATTTITLLVNTATWNGNTSNNALTTTNWTGCAPAAGIKVIIPAGTTNAPSILLTSDVLTVGDLEIASGATFSNIGTLNITGVLSNNGTLTSNSGVNGTIGFTGTTAQTIPANAFSNNTIRNLVINNTAGVTLAGTLNLTGTLTPTAGTLTTGGFLTLKYTSGSVTAGGGHARVATGSTLGGYISGNVTVERFIQRNYRRYRFLGHPFTSLPLTEWTDDFDISGTITGSNANNFTTTQTNNPSAFTYNEAVGNTSISPDPGWTAITSGNTVTSLGTAVGARVMVRGSKGQTGSLTGGTYTPDSVIIDMTGALFQGNLNVPLTFSGPSASNNQKGYTLLCNPYASSWDFSTAVRNNVDNAVYQYRPSINAYCAWINGTAINGGSQYIEMSAAFLVHANNVTSPSLTFTEAGKATNVPTQTKLRTSRTIHNRLSLTLVQDATAMTDEVAVRFGDDPATDKFDSEFDAYNLESDLDFYIAGADDVRYAIFHGSELKTADVENRTVALGFKVLTPGAYTINAKILDAFNGGHIVYLKDAVLNTLTPINENTAYRFEATAGDTKDRFSLVFKPAKKVADVIKAGLTTYPNPAKDVLNVTYAGLNAKGAASIRLINTAGKTVKTISLAAGTEGRQSISLKGLAKGLYTVQLVQNGTTQTQNVVVD